MKKTLLSFMGLFLFMASALAQLPAVSGNLVLRLNMDAPTNYFISGGIYTWKDLSPKLNHVTQSVASQAPTVVTGGGGFQALNFNAAAGQFLSNTTATGLNNPQSTIFVVCESNPATPSLTSISLISKTWNTDEMLMSSGGSCHHTWSGNFYYKTHPCYPTTPSNRPVVLTGVFRPGITNSDLDFYVNNVKSTNTITSHGGPLAYYSVPRDIYIGKRLLHPEYMMGKIFEVLVYDRDLSSAEIDLVNNYLKCKYNTDVYASATCNPAVGSSSTPVPGVTLSAVSTGNTGSPDYNCTFTCTATTASPSGGWTPQSYTYSIGGTPYVTNVSSSPTDAANIIIPNGSTSDVDVKVVYKNRCTGKTGWATTKIRLYCNGGHGGNYRPGATGINTPEIKDNITLFPNPTNETLNIKSTETPINKVSVTDVSGRILIFKEFKGLTEVQLSLKHLAVGTYIVKINDTVSKIITRSE